MVVQFMNMLNGSSFRDSSELSSVVEVRLSLLTEKRDCFGLKMNTAVNCCGSVSSGKSMNQEVVVAGADLDRPFSCCLHVWWPRWLARHAVVQDCSTLINRYYNKYCKWMQQGMVASMTMRVCPTLFRVQPGSGMRGPKKISIGDRTSVLMTSVMQSLLREQRPCFRFAFRTVCCMRLDCWWSSVWLLFLRSLAATAP